MKISDLDEVITLSKTRKRLEAERTAAAVAPHLLLECEGSDPYFCLTQEETGARGTLLQQTKIPIEAYYSHEISRIGERLRELGVEL